jgi:hypothetical protein
MKYISINGHVIRSNAKHGTGLPPIRIASSKHDRYPRYANEITIDGPSRLIYSPEKSILNCGARLVIEAEAVTIIK